MFLLTNFNFILLTTVTSNLPLAIINNSSFLVPYLIMISSGNKIIGLASSITYSSINEKLFDCYRIRLLIAESEKINLMTYPRILGEIKFKNSVSSV